MQQPARERRRRFDTGWVGTPQHFRWLEGFVRAVIVLNVADALFTVWWIATHQAVEANPLLAELAHEHPVTFVVVKVTLVSLGTLLLWNNRKRPLAVIAIFVVFLAYYFLLMLHLDALNPQLMARLRTCWA